ncbi:hypothetical protein [Paenibacillus polymyxa]|uniref:hypothetical protein n=1 Tax=Paenibacillus polymyxa TaxID=1406 RepID=UPI002ED237E0
MRKQKKKRCTHKLTYIEVIWLKLDTQVLEAVPQIHLDQGQSLFFACQRTSM